MDLSEFWRTTAMELINAGGERPSDVLITMMATATSGYAVIYGRAATLAMLDQVAKDGLPNLACTDPVN